MAGRRLHERGRGVLAGWAVAGGRSGGGTAGWRLLLRRIGGTGPLAGGAAETAAEDAVEVGEVAVAAGEGDAGDRVGAVVEQLGGVVEAEAGEGVEEGGAGVGAEKFAEVAAGEAGAGRGVVQGPFVVECFGEFPGDGGNAAGGGIGGSGGVGLARDGDQDLGGEGVEGDGGSRAGFALFEEGTAPEVFKALAGDPGGREEPVSAVGEGAPEVAAGRVVGDPRGGEAEQEEGGGGLVAELVDGAVGKGEEGAGAGGEFAGVGLTTIQDVAAEDVDEFVERIGAGGHPEIRGVQALGKSHAVRRQGDGDGAGDFTHGLDGEEEKGVFDRGLGGCRG